VLNDECKIINDGYQIGYGLNRS